MHRLPRLLAETTDKHVHESEADIAIPLLESALGVELPGRTPGVGNGLPPTGDNIRLDLPVSIDEAALGGKVRVPTVDGPVMLSVPRGSSSGRVLRLKGKGFTGKNGQRGDQLATLMVEVPDDPALANFLEGWSGARHEFL